MGRGRVGGIWLGRLEKVFSPFGREVIFRQLKENEFMGKINFKIFKPIKNGKIEIIHTKHTLSVSLILFYIYLGVSFFFIF